MLALQARTPVAGRYTPLQRLPMRTFLYWFMSVFMIIFLLVSIFGLAGWAVDSGVNQVKLFSIGLFAIGLVIVVLSLHHPQRLFRDIVRRPVTTQGSGYGDVGGIIVGLSLLVGSILYAYFATAGVIVGSFAFGAIVLRLRMAYLKYKYGNEA